MEVQDRVTVEADLLRRAHKERDRVLVIENHLGLQLVAVLRFFAEFDQTSRIKQ